MNIFLVEYPNSIQLSMFTYLLNAVKFWFRTTETSNTGLWHTSLIELD